LSNIKNILNLFYSIIIPVYNRPQEIRELLESLLNQTYNKMFEVIIIEGGSINKSDKVIKEYQSKLTIQYLYKANSGPGQSRNEGMKITKGNYFIILDSDVILTKNYLLEIDKTLQDSYTDAFTAPDKAHNSFTNIQKAINYAMTSFLTTGGLRTNKGSQKFQLRSFNMGLSKKAFEKSNGFSQQNFGEDIDLSLRIDRLGLTKQFIPNAFVYHKRRTDWRRFYEQTFNFGAARPILNLQHKNSSKLTYWLPSFFIVTAFLALVACNFSFFYFAYLFLFYFSLTFIDSLFKNKNSLVAFLSIIATIVQFSGYGFGFLQSQFRLNVLKKTAKETFPKMFS